MLHGAPTYTIRKLQRVQNNAVRIVLQAPRRFHATPLLNTLHWLPVQQRLTSRWLCWVSRSAARRRRPTSIHRLLQDRENVHNLRRRSATPALCRPFTKTTIAKRAFSCTAPAIWNSLPKTVLYSDTLTSFKSRPKTHLFSQAFSHTPTDH